MRVLVDTTIWSLALRRRNPRQSESVLIGELSQLVQELRAALIGPVRQEVLSGIPDTKDFEVVREHLDAFDDLEIVSDDYVEAARMFNACKRKGLQGSHIDFLTCAVSNRHSTPVFTTDKDFKNYARHVELQLYRPRERRHTLLLGDSEDLSQVLNLRRIGGHEVKHQRRRGGTQANQG